MSMLEMAIIYGSTFLQVFLMGFQSKNVMQSRYILAFATSMGIAATNLIVIRAVANTADPAEIFLVYSLGGASGICFAIFTHDKLMGLFARLKEGWGG